MRTSTIKSLAAVALTGAGSALVIGFQTSPSPVASISTTSTTSTSTASASASTSTASASSASTSTASASASTPTSSTTSPTPSTSTSTATATASPTAAAATAPSTGYGDGTYTGDAVSEPWGAFQVQVTVSGGQITAVDVVQAPQDNHSSRINSSAIPTLTAATLASQDASVDLISGATWTSRSYATSLQSALDAAKAAAATTTSSAG